jgi:CHASE3 domain sensor protein
MSRRRGNQVQATTGCGTHEILENLQDLRFALESVESSVRGYVLTGKESYLDTYRRANRTRPARSEKR